MEHETLVIQAHAAGRRSERRSWKAMFADPRAHYAVLWAIRSADLLAF